VGKKEKGWVHTSNPPHPDGRVPYNVLTNFNLDTPPNFIDVKKPRGKESISEHPTQKPLKLMMWLINLTTNPGDTILDPFGGSGTTGEAALLLNRTPILIERDPEYADVIDKRLTNLPNQWVLNEQLKASEDTVLQSLFEF
jgi:DNA modification methylase